MASTVPKYNLYSDAFRRDTYATFARMREQDPVLCQPGIDGETPIWFVTRYDDAEAVLLDDERFVRDPRLALPSGQLRHGRLAVAEGELPWRPVPLFRSLVALPVVWDT